MFYGCGAVRVVNELYQDLLCHSAYPAGLMKN